MGDDPTGGPPAVIALLADRLRWRLVAALAHSDARAADLGALVGQPAPDVASALQPLQADGIVAERPSDADPDDVYYRLDPARLRDLLQEAALALHPALTPDAPARPRILFLCTHNSARSQMAEALARALSKGGVEAYSAGTEPRAVHPMALQQLEERQISTEGLHAKSVAEFLGQEFDYVVTVCDRARESCPDFPGREIHWSVPDPAEAEGAAARRAFHLTAVELTNRIQYLLTAIARAQAPDQHPSAGQRRNWAAGQGER